MATQLPPDLVPELLELLRTECELQERYGNALESEGGHLAKFSADDIQRIAGEREKLFGKITELHIRRIQLMKQFPNHRASRLSDLIEKHCTEDEQQELLPLVDKLRRSVAANQRRGREHSQILQFASTIVNGSLSILWSATQQVSQFYGRSGAVKEKLTPKSRQHNKLEEA